MLSTGASNRTLLVSLRSGIANRGCRHTASLVPAVSRNGARGRQHGCHPPDGSV